MDDSDRRFSAKPKGPSQACEEIANAMSIRLSAMAYAAADDGSFDERSWRRGFMAARSRRVIDPVHYRWTSAGLIVGSGSGSGSGSFVSEDAVIRSVEREDAAVRSHLPVGACVCYVLDLYDLDRLSLIVPSTAGFPSPRHPDLMGCTWLRFLTARGYQFAWGSGAIAKADEDYDTYFDPRRPHLG